MKRHSLLPPSKYTRGEKIFDLIHKLTGITINGDENLRIESKPTKLSASLLRYNLQQPNKKLDDDDYFNRLGILSVNKCRNLQSAD